MGILSAKKQQLSDVQKQLEALKPVEAEAEALRKKCEALSADEQQKWAEQCQTVSAELATVRSEAQTLMVQLTESESKCVLVEREKAQLSSQLSAQEQELGAQHEVALAALRKKMAQKTEEVRRRAREMLEDKDRQLAVSRNRLNATRSGSVSRAASPMPAPTDEFFADKETQTEGAEDGDEDVQGGDGDEADVDIAVLARLQTAREGKVREFQSRLRRLQELLRKSEEEHKRKDSELGFVRSQLAQIEGAKDVQKTADNSAYLKNALLQYFDARIDIKQLADIAAVGLRFSAEEQSKAQSAKLLNEEDNAGIGGYVKSWWG